MARSLPEGESLLVRTDFTDDATWAQTLAAVIASYDEDMSRTRVLVASSGFHARRGRVSRDRAGYARLRR
ncbi:DUF6924 domain-containing protein [Nocardia exalbida]|uniref:DUF6924 domain-containing protein n=1 Tax=Nocardia exalbida TaxID=290231 RepID=UPI003570B0FF